MNVIESDEGFSVEVLGRTGLRYCEGARCMRVDAEVLVGPAGLVVYRRSVKAWDPPHGEEVIDDGKRSAIIENIRMAFRFRGFDIDVS